MKRKMSLTFNYLALSPHPPHPNLRGLVYRSKSPQELSLQVTGLGGSGGFWFKSQSQTKKMVKMVSSLCGINKGFMGPFIRISVTIRITVCYLSTSSVKLRSGAV